MLRWITCAVAVYVVLTGNASREAHAASEWVVVPVALPAPSTAITFNPDPAAKYHFVGVGFGHGVGMSQWGARGRALAGESAAAIISAYYPGTTLGTVSGAQQTVRVGLLVDTQPPVGASIDVVAGPVVVTGLPAPLNSGASFRLGKGPAGMHVDALDPSGRQVGSVPIQGPTTISGDDTTLLRVDFKTAPAVPGAPGQTYNVYRGSLTLIAAPSGLTVVNTVPLEQYVEGTVPSEEPSSWPPEALRAQAIAARTYAVRELQPSSAPYDVTDTTASQVYLGALKETAATTAAVTSTSGTIILFQGDAILAYYHACDAGHTENASDVFPGIAAPYLLGVPDVNAQGTSFDADCPRDRWSTAPVKVGLMQQALGPDISTAVGTLRWIDLSTRTPNGRVISVMLGGSSGTVSLPTQAFRNAFNATVPSANEILSTNFEIEPAP